MTSHEVVVKTIASTRTSTGLRVAAQLDTGAYPLGVSVSKQRMQALPLAPHSWCGSWNYTIGTAATDPNDGAAGQQIKSLAGADSTNQALALARALEILSDPLLTGMNRHELDELAAGLALAQAAQTAQRRYAKTIDGQEEAARQRVMDALGHRGSAQ